MYIISRARVSFHNTICRRRAVLLPRCNLFGEQHLFPSHELFSFFFPFFFASRWFSSGNQVVVSWSLSLLNPEKFSYKTIDSYGPCKNFYFVHSFFAAIFLQSGTKLSLGNLFKPELFFIHCVPNKEMKKSRRFQCWIYECKIVESKNKETNFLFSIAPLLIRVKLLPS